jgi:membrane protease YdiL (CAAX protease family)
VASKVFKIDVTSKTGFSLAGSISTTLYGAYHFENKYAKGIFGLCAFILFGYMMNKKSIAN